MKSRIDFDTTVDYRNYLIDYYSGLFSASLIQVNVERSDGPERLVNVAIRYATHLSHKITKKYL